MLRKIALSRNTVGGQASVSGIAGKLVQYLVRKGTVCDATVNESNRTKSGRRKERRVQRRGKIAKKVLSSSAKFCNRYCRQKQSDKFASNRFRKPESAHDLSGPLTIASICIDYRISPTSFGNARNPWLLFYDCNQKTKKRSNTGYVA